MKRRELFAQLALVPLLPNLWPLSSRNTSARKQLPARRVRPSDAAWPSAAEWERLKQAIGGHLIEIRSPLGPCDTNATAAACRAALADLQNPYYVGDQPGATQSSGWVDAWMSAPSMYAVAAHSAPDVAAAVNFAREHNLRLVVKGGGHSYQGTSNAPDSLLIWTRPMNRVTLHEAFMPQGGSGRQIAHPAATIEAGAMWIDAYNAVTTEGHRYVQGGGCTTVGVAGLIQSGGFGSFSKRYGMAAAGLLEAEIVTADGQVRIVNAFTNPDLFWALKGGGGGSFGVVTKLTLKTHDLPPFFGAVFFSIEAQSDAAFRRLLTRFVGFYADSLFNPSWGETVHLHGRTLSVNLVSSGLDKEAAEQIWRPFFNWIATAPSDFKSAGEPAILALPAQYFWDAEFLEKHLPTAIHIDSRSGAPKTHFWWAGDGGQVGTFWHGYQSAWLPSHLLHKEQQPRLVEALFNASRYWEVELHFNKGLAGAAPDVIALARDTAMNPAVLDAFALAIIAGGSPPAYPEVPGHTPDLAEARKDAAAISGAMHALRSVAPQTGSYVSESNFFEPSWQTAFWGTNYPRLQAVKAKYDPTGLFFVHHGVGSEEWTDNGFTRLT